MFLSKLVGVKRAMKMHSILNILPREIRDELKNIRIVYRGIVSVDGKEGDLLVRMKNNKLYNVVWQEDYGEVREIDRAYLKSMTKFYDSFIQDLVIHERNKTLSKLYIINQKIMLRSTSFKKVNPIT